MSSCSLTRKLLQYVKSLTYHQYCTLKASRRTSQSCCASNKMSLKSNSEAIVCLSVSVWPGGTGGLVIAPPQVEPCSPPCYVSVDPERSEVTQGSVPLTSRVFWVGMMKLSDMMDEATKVKNKLVFPAEPLTPKPKPTRPNRRPRAPTASPASPGWWPKSSRLHSTSRVSERLI